MCQEELESFAEQLEFLDARDALEDVLNQRVFVGRQQLGERSLHEREARGVQLRELDHLRTPRRAAPSAQQQCESLMCIYMSDIRAHNLHVHVGTLPSIGHYFHLEHGECEALVGDQVRREEREMRRLLLTQRVQQLELVPQVELNTNLKQTCVHSSDIC